MPISTSQSTPRQVADFAYRAEVDGLRAVAVVPVVLFHAGLPWLSGGYVGVDVFFVISGYLITSIILAEQSEGRFSIAAFYERRARRILPALFLVMLACLPFAWWWMTPHHLKSLAQSMVAATWFVPNLYFFLKNGYFETDADEKPLIHTWSLGVEEQYYIAFPWLVMACRRFGPGMLGTMIAVTAIVSLVASEWAAHFHPVGNFYLAPTRAWELALGSLLAMAAIHDLPRMPLGLARRNLLSMAGLAMIIVPMFAYGPATLFPGLHALAPTVGAALVIGFARADTLVGRLLSWRPMVGIGLVSYSIYLWHQPLFAFARLYSTGKPAPWLLGVLTLTSLALAGLTWRFVELPFRDRHRFDRRRIFTLALSGSVALCIFGLVGHFTEGLPGRLKPEQREILAYGEQPENQKAGFAPSPCFLAPGENSAALGRCIDHAEARGPSVFLWGDSHASHLYPGLHRQLADTTKFSYVTASACPPLVTGESGLGSACRDFNRAALARIIHDRPDSVILAAVWGNYRWAELAATLAALKENGIQKIEVVGPVPRWNPSLPVVIARFRVNFAELPIRTRLGLDVSTQLLDAQMRQFCHEHGVQYISPYASLCNNDGCVIRVGQDIASMLQWDVSHLTRRGSEYLMARIRPQSM